MGLRDFFPASGAASATIPLDNYKPAATLNATPMLFGMPIIVGSGDQGQGCQWVFVPRSGQNGAIFEFTDMGGASDRLGNGIWNYSAAYWGGTVNYHRQDNAAVTLTGAAKTLTTANGQTYAFGGNTAHDSGTRGSYWEYTQTGNRFVVFRSVFSNGGFGLVAVDSDPFAANGAGVLTVTSAQTAGGQAFDSAIIASLPAPWNTLSTLEGCKYISCFGSEVRQTKWIELWSGAEGAHTIRVAATNTGSGGATNRVYLSAFGYQSAADAAVTSTYAPPSPSTNTSGRTLAAWVDVYQVVGTSMQEFLEQYQPSGTTQQFNGGNHTDGFTSPTASGESVSTGFRLTGTVTSGSVGVTAATDTGDLQNADNLVIFTTPIQLGAAANPTSKTASTFNLAANSTVTVSSPASIWRADWTITAGATSATQAFTGTNLPAAGDILWLINSSGSAFCVVVRSVSGSNITFDRSVTTTTGMYVVLLGKANSSACFFADGIPIFARPYEIIVATSNALTCEMRHTRTHPQIVTTLSAGPARGDTTVSVTSATGLLVGQPIQIHAPRGRYVGMITGISGTTITVDPPLTQGFASGVRFGRGTQHVTNRSFRAGDTYAFYYTSANFGYYGGDSSPVSYTTMQTTNSTFETGKTFDQSGTATARTWVNSNTDSATVDIQACVMNSAALGLAHMSRIFDGKGTGRYQTRSGTPGLSKVYISSEETVGSLSPRNPNTQITANFAVDIRPGNF